MDEVTGGDRQIGARERPRDVPADEAVRAVGADEPVGLVSVPRRGVDRPSGAPDCSTNSVTRCGLQLGAGGDRRRQQGRVELTPAGHDERG